MCINVVYTYCINTVKTSIKMIKKIQKNDMHPQVGTSQI